MTIYKVLDLVNGKEEFFVDNQNIVDENPHVKCIVGTEADAIARHAVNTANYMAQEAYRFTINKEIVDGLNTTWIAVTDLESDIHDGGYFVFNTLSGLHERAENKDAAKDLSARIKQEFIDYSDLTSIKIVDSLPSKDPVDVSRFGEVIGNIPVEIM